MGKRSAPATEVDDTPPGDEPPVDEGSGDASGDGSPPAKRGPSAGGSSLSAVDDGAGWVLGLLLWAWIVLPFFKGGPAQVKKTLKAKFLNQAPDGSPLP